MAVKNGKKGRGEKMIKTKKYLGIAAGIICAILTSLSVFAAEPSAGVKIPVEQRFDNQSRQEAESTFHYILKAADRGIPMPKGSKEDTYSFSMTGTQTIFLDEISYVTPGVYCYEVFQDVSEQQEDYQYDESRYIVAIHVKNTVSQGLETEIFIQNDEGEKCEGLIFENKFNGKSEENQPPKDGGQDSRNPVKTGDETAVSAWLILMGVSSLSMLLLSLYSGGLTRKRKEKNNGKKKL